MFDFCSTRIMNRYCNRIVFINQVIFMDSHCQ